ncbi:hypothetical protein PY479_08915 [Shewanella sp. A32]|uniref:hypothetical protein n=1 Tax=Shewanella sp. A32 TaxID=3031327 RepID=UPI0023BA21C9|nr:hypothetical protein [Shewanella sp. A32]MDF0534394.1 hypothetical protein [Shewanella sp. A32]
MKKSLLCTAITALMLNGYYINVANAEPQPPQKQEQPNKANNAEKNKASKSNANAKSTQMKHQDKNQQSHQNQSQQSRHGSAGGSAHQPMGIERSSPNSNAAYAISTHNKHVIKQHYQRILSKVDRNRRPKWERGEVIPDRYRPYITPAPSSLIQRLNDVPKGCDVGYYQGYTVVYDPTTFMILTLVDLLVD